MKASRDRAVPTYLRLVRECLRFPGELLFSTLGAAGIAVAGLRLAWLFKEWTEGPILAGESEKLAGLVLQGVAWTVILAASVFLSRYFTSKLNQKLMEALRNRSVERLLAGRVSAVRAYPAGDLLSRVFNDVAAAGGFPEAGIRRLIEDLALFGGALVMMFVLDPKLALAACVIVPAVGALLIGIGSTIRRWTAAAHAAIGAVSGALTEQISGLTTIKSSGTERHEAQRFTGLHESFRRRMLRVESWSAGLQVVVFLATGLALLAGMAVLSRRLLQGEVTAAALLAFFVYAGMTVEPLRRLSQVQALLQRSLAAAGRVFEVIDLPDLEELDRGRPLPAPVRGELRLERVVFGYGSGPPVLDRLDLRVRPYEQIALVGESGAGKSTVARLLVRHEDPRSGRILLDGEDLQDLKLRELRRAICVVEQEAFLFGGSLLENLRYGSVGRTTREVEQAVRAVGLEPLVALLPRGLDSAVAEAGRSLSGGERQRVALARAILRDPPVLVLDEATNALDGESEAEIFDSLATWLSRRTVLLFAHRLSTISRFPRVAVLEKGQVAEEGSAPDLLARSSVFARLIAEQAEMPVAAGEALSIG